MQRQELPEDTFILVVVYSAGEEETTTLQVHIWIYPRFQKVHMACAGTVAAVLGVGWVGTP